MRRRRVAALAILQLRPIDIRQLYFVPLHLTGLGLNCLLEVQYLKPSFIYLLAILLADDRSLLAVWPVACVVSGDDTVC